MKTNNHKEEEDDLTNWDWRTNTDFYEQEMAATSKIETLVPQEPSIKDAVSVSLDYSIPSSLIFSLPLSFLCPLLRTVHQKLVRI